MSLILKCCIPKRAFDVWQIFWSALVASLTWAPWLTVVRWPWWIVWVGLPYWETFLINLQHSIYALSPNNLLIYLFIFGCTCSMWKFPSQEWNLHHSSNPSCCSDNNAISVTHCTVRKHSVLGISKWTGHISYRLYMIKSNHSSFTQKRHHIYISPTKFAHFKTI